MFLYLCYKATFYNMTRRELMNGVQTLFLTVDNRGLIQATLAIARLTLSTHSKKGNLQKKKYLWNPSLLLHSFGCGRLEIDEH